MTQKTNILTDLLIKSRHTHNLDPMLIIQC